MDFALTEEQLELQAMVREFVEKEIVLTRMKWIKTMPAVRKLSKKQGTWGC